MHALEVFPSNAKAAKLADLPAEGDVTLDVRLSDGAITQISAGAAQIVAGSTSPAKVVVAFASPSPVITTDHPFPLDLPAALARLQASQG